MPTAGRLSAVTPDKYSEYDKQMIVMVLQRQRKINLRLNVKL